MKTLSINLLFFIIRWRFWWSWRVMLSLNRLQQYWKS